MANFKSFEEILAWQKARVLTKEIYIVTSANSFDRDYSLRDQMRRASVSVMANIAEGYERKTDKEFLRFLRISKASLAELKSHTFVSYDIGYIAKEVFSKLILVIDEVGKILSGLSTYLKNSVKSVNKSEAVAKLKD